MMKRILSVLGALCMLALCVVVVALIAADYSWYRSLGFAQVFSVSWWSRGLTLAFFVLVTYALFLSTLFAVRKRVKGQKSRVATWSTHTIAILLSILASLQISTQWKIFRLAVSGQSFGQIEPFTKLDVSFFVFTLPAAERLVSWLLSLVVLEGIWIAILITYLPKRPATKAKSRTAAGATATATAGDTKAAKTAKAAQAKAQVSTFWDIARAYVRPLLAALMFVVSINIALSAFALLYQQGGFFPGLSYVDARLRFPGLLVTAALALIVAVCLLALRRRKTLVIIFGLWAVLAIVGLSVAPPVLSALWVKPNELTFEQPYLQHALDMTRASWGLDKVKSLDYLATTTLSDEQNAAIAAELQNARIWTPSALKQAFTQLETIRPYYQLSTIQPDRYQVNGAPAEVLVAAREMDTSGLPKNAQNWINQHLVYTHGYGLSIASATAVDEGGFPQFLVSEVPPVVASEVATCAPALATTEPRIYFGQSSDDWVITGTTLDEFDRSDAGKTLTTRYEGTLGIPLDSFATRALWALKLGSKDLLLSGYLTRDSQLLTNRSITARVARLAPWLELDDRPYPALVEGRIYWILDGFTSSNHFPFSKAVDGGSASSTDRVNYRRNSVKAVVDAYTGEVRLYAFGDDPLRDAWAAIYPGTVVAAGETSPALAKHFRYPVSYFQAQAEVFSAFHLDEPTAFYHKDNLWGQFSVAEKIAGEQDGTNTLLEPSYHLLTLPGETQPTYALVLPYSAPGKDNMISLLAASSNPESYGELTAYHLPPERITLGPQQVLARIQQDPEIAQNIALWNQNGNTVVYGDMLILPVEGSFVYVQPIFLKAQNAAITEVVSVVVVQGESVHTGATISEALSPE